MFKWLPKDMGDVPAWAELMYSGTDDFEAVVDQRAWWSEPDLREDPARAEFQALADAWSTGSARMAGFGMREWATAEFEAGGGVAGQLARQAESDPEWQAIGPFETYNNGEQGPFPCVLAMQHLLL